MLLDVKLFVLDDYLAVHCLLQVRQHPCRQLRHLTQFPLIRLADDVQQRLVKREILILVRHRQQTFGMRQHVLDRDIDHWQCFSIKKIHRTFESIARVRLEMRHR